MAKAATESFSKFGMLVFQLAQKHGYTTVSAIAERLGCTRQYVSTCVLRKELATAEMILKLSKALDLTPEEEDQLFRCRGKRLWISLTP